MIGSTRAFIQVTASFAYDACGQQEELDLSDFNIEEVPPSATVVSPETPEQVDPSLLEKGDTVIVNFPQNKSRQRITR
jgi:hypothetical protein